jgi:hypothetical protein
LATYIPFLGLLGFRVGNGLGLILEPVLGLGSGSVGDHQRCILIPVGRLAGGCVVNLGDVNPSLGLEVLRVIYESAAVVGYRMGSLPISAGGLTAGSKSSNKLPFLADSSLIKISKV